MLSTFITCMQLFGMGLVFGFSGPCFLTCTPAVIAVANAAGYERRQALRHFLLFAVGRLAAYTALGVIAGLSGQFAEQALGQSLFLFFRVVAAVVCGILSLSLFFDNVPACFCRTTHLLTATRVGSFILLGFLLSVVPCVPMITLLTEIMVMSQSVAAAAGYTFCVGVGTVAASAVFFGGALGLTWVTPGILHRSRVRRGLQVASAALLLAFALVLLMQLGMER